MNVLLLTAHSIAEYDDLRMLADIGLDVFSIGAYTNPHDPGDVTRPALWIPRHPDLEAAVTRARERHAGEDETWAIDWAKADLPPEVLDWADTIICHHYLDRWIVPQWQRIRAKRVIWRTCGQSDPPLERLMKPLRSQGLQIVRYSPAEEETFRAWGDWAGQDALIRFGKYWHDFPRWSGESIRVANVTQDMPGRGNHVGRDYWLAATAGLPAAPAGGGSEALPGGLGFLPYEAMLTYLQDSRVYLYTGTVPASYTLGLIEALMVGIPVVSIARADWLGPEDLFEGPALARGISGTFEEVQDRLRAILVNDYEAMKVSALQAESARMFDVRRIRREWGAFLGVEVRPWENLV